MRADGGIPDVGHRVVLIRPHPEAGKAGDVIGHNAVGRWPCAIVQLNDGRRITVMHHFEWTYAN